MSFRLTILLAVAVLGLGAGAAAATAENPYQPIPRRNVFGLNPIPTNNPADQKPPEPPSKIIPNGIMTIFGKVQVLFKVQEPGRAGQPAKEQSYIMGEGERQDDIEVQKINEKAAAITFNNRGIVQTLELVKATASGGAPAPGGASAVPATPAAAAAAAIKGAVPGVPATTVGFGARFGRNRTTAPGTAGSDAAGMGAARSSVTSEANEKITPEEQVIRMETQRAKWLDEGNPAALIIPPTPLTKQVTGEEDAPAPPAPPMPGVP
jgi:hypothetical protein